MDGPKEVNIQEHGRWAERSLKNSSYDICNGCNTMRRLFHGQPIVLNWMGWRTDTHLLERQGWQILAEEHQDLYSDRHIVRIGCHSPDKKVLLSGTYSVYMREILGDPNYRVSSESYMLFHRGIDVCSYSFRDTFAQIEATDFKSLNSLAPIDIRQPVDISMNRFDYRRLKCFEYLENTGGQEIFIKPGSVDECLDMILKIQYPDQQALKKSLILPEKKPIIQAKIFSLAV